MNREEITKLRERLVAVSDNMEELVRVTDAEARQFSEDEGNRFNALNDEHKRTKADIDRREAVMAAKACEAETTRVSKPQDIETSTISPTSRIDVIHAQPKSNGWKRFGTKAGEAAYRSGQWILANVYGNERSRNWCQDNGVELRAGGISVLAAGGILVPDELDTAIIDLREQYGVFRREARVVPMASDTKDVPRRVSGVTAYAVGEGTEITDSDKGWDMVTLSAKMWGCLTKMSKELSADAVINVADDLASEMGYAFALKEDQAGINGDGTSTYHGISGIRAKMIDGNHAGSYFTAPGAANSCDIWSEVGLDDLDGTMGILPAYALMRSPKWYCPVGAVHSIFGRLVRAQGGSTGKELADGVPQTYAGYPIVPVPAWADTASTDYSAKIMLLFGDLALAAMVGDRQGTSVQVLQERYAELGVLGVIGNIRFDVNIHDIGSSTAPGPVVGLLGN